MRSALSIASFALAVLVASRVTLAHCEVPCGIYADEARFKTMLENTETIAKAQANINEFVGGEMSALAVNQAARWVATKEAHATDTQHIIAQYFMTQRIKPDQPKYTERLTAAHAVMVAAMKCKQSADPATSEALTKAILDFYRAYEGKEPVFDDHK